MAEAIVMCRLPDGGLVLYIVLYSWYGLWLVGMGSSAKVSSGNTITLDGQQRFKRA